MRDPAQARGGVLRAVCGRDVHLPARACRHHRRHQRVHHPPRHQPRAHQATVDDPPANANSARFRGGKIIGYLRRQRTVSRICKQTSAVTVDDRRRQYTGDDEVLDEGNKQ